MQSTLPFPPSCLTPFKTSLENFLDKVKFQRLHKLNILNVKFFILIQYYATIVYFRYLRRFRTMRLKNFWQKNRNNSRFGKKIWVDQIFWMFCGCFGYFVDVFGMFCECFFSFDDVLECFMNVFCLLRMFWNVLGMFSVFGECFEVLEVDFL
jgi:hypothetical protein